MSSPVQFNEAWMGGETPPDPEPSLAELLEDAVLACGGRPDPQVLRAVADRLETEALDSACRLTAAKLRDVIDRLPKRDQAAWLVLLGISSTREAAEGSGISHVAVHKKARRMGRSIGLAM